MGRRQQKQRDRGYGHPTQKHPSYQHHHQQPLALQDPQHRPGYHQGLQYRRRQQQRPLQQQDPQMDTRGYMQRARDYWNGHQLQF